MFNNKRKLYGFILGTIMFVMLLVSFSYAFYSWRSSESDVSVTISDSYFYCESGVSGSGVLPITSSYKSGITQSVKVNNVGKSDTNISMSLNIKSVKDSSGNSTDALFDSSMEYVVMVDTTGGNNDCTTSSSCTEVATGDFSDFKVGMNTLVENISLPNNSRHEYYLFLYINENEENDSAMQGVTLNYTLDICEVVAFFNYRGGVVTEEFRKLTEETYGTSSNPLPRPTHNDHVVTYNTNGGSNIGNSSVSYTFDGWYLDETFASNKKVVDSTPVQKTTNHTLYANWIASGTVTLPTLTRGGYIFEGWYSDSGLTNKVGDAGESYTPDILKTSTTLYAKWTPITYTVEYYNGTTIIGSSTHTFGVSKKLTTWANLGASVTYADKKWSFNGWNRNNNNPSMEMMDGQSVMDLTVTNNDVIKLYAVYQRTISFKHGGSGASSNTVVQRWNPYGRSNGTHITRISTPDIASISGWTALGWRYDTTAGTNVSELGGATSSNIYIDVDKGNQLYAVYSRSYTANFYSYMNKLGVKTLDPTTHYYNSFQTEVPSTVSITLLAATDSTDIQYWTELGWRDDTTAGDKEYAYGATVDIPWETTEFYSVYSRSYTANFYSGANGTTVKTKQSETLYFNSSLSAVPTFVSITLLTAGDSADVSGWTEHGWKPQVGSTTTYGYGDTVTVEWGTNFYSAYGKEYTFNFYSGVNGTTVTTKSSNIGFIAGQGVPTTVKLSLEEQSNVTSISGWTKLGWRDDTTAGDKEYAYGQTNVDVSSSVTDFYSVYSRSYTANFYSGVSKATTKTKTSSTLYYNSYQTSTPTTVSIVLDTAANSTDITNWTELGWRDDTTADNIKTGYEYGATITTAWGTNFYSVYSRLLSVKYDGNGATSGSMSDTTKTIYLNSNSTSTSNQNVTLSANGFTKTGHNFKNFNTASDGSGTAYSPGGTYNPTVAYNANPFSKTIYAQWTAIPVTVTYDSGNLLYGLENNVSETDAGNMKYSISNSVVTVTAKVNDGYGFIPVRVRLTAGTEYTFSCTTNGSWGSVEAFLMLDGIVSTYYRMDSNSNFKFTPSTTGEYWLRLDVNTSGSTNTFSNITIKRVTTETINYGAKYTLPSTPLKTGYTFKGWYTAASGGSVVTSSTTLTNASNHTIYGQWTVNNYSITYNTNGGTLVGSGYTPLEYIQATGTQYIDTGLKVNFNDSFDYVIKANFTNSNYGGANGYLQFKGDLALNTKKTIKVSYNGSTHIETTYVDGVQTTTNDWNSYQKSNVKIGIFKLGDADNGWYSGSAQAGKVYGVTIYNNGRMVRNMIPAKNSSGTVGLYDSVNGTFYTNAGTGSFTAGPVVNSYTIESTGFDLPTPSKTGNTFGGWYTSSDLTGTAVTQLPVLSSDNKTYYAKWTATDYIVTFDKKGGTGGTNSVTATYGSAMPSITVPTYSGENFNGYYSTENAIDMEYSIEKFSGVARINFFKDANEWLKTSADVGTHVQAVITVNTSSKPSVVEFNDIAVSTSNYYVTGGSGSWKIYVDFDVTSNMLTPRSYNYDTSLRFIDIENSEITTSTSVSVILAVKDGKKYYSSSGTSVWNYDVPGNTTLVAKKSTIGYTLTVKSGTGGSVKVEDTTKSTSVTAASGETKTLAVNHGDTIKVTATPNTEYSLNTLKHGSTSMSSGGTFTATGNETVEATWEKKKFKLSFKANNSSYGTVSKNELTNVPYGTTYSVSGGTITFSNSVGSVVATVTNATGYTTTFTGWSPSSGTITAATTFTANFTRTTNTYNVIYNCNGGSGSTDNSSHTYGVAKNLNPNLCYRVGYSFNGWNTKSDGSGTSYANQASVTNLSTGTNVTLYAKWSINTYTISYNYDGGSVSSANPTSYNVNTTPITLNTPSKTGYSFNGYKTETISTSNWVSGFVNNSTGALSSYNSTYPNSVYSELIYLESGVTYTLSGTSLGGIRWRFFDTSGSYVGNTSGATFTPSQNGYVRILLYEGCTEANRNAAVISSSQVTSGSIAKGSTGNRSYKATWALSSVTVTYDSGNLVYGLTNTSSAVSSSYMSYTITDGVVSVTGASSDGYGFTTGRVRLNAGTTYYFSCTTSGTWGSAVEAFLMLNGSTSTAYYHMSSNNNFSFTPSTTGEYWLRLDVNANGTTHTFSDITIKQISTQTLEYGKSYTFPTTQTRTRYTFSGWYTAASGGDAVTTSTNVTNASAHTIYGRWTENYLTVNYYSNYATASFSDPLNPVGANSNVLVKTSNFKADTAYPSGLHNYKATSAGTYLGRTGYTGTGNWGTSTSGGTLVSQSDGFTSGYELASTLGKDVSSGNVSISLYPQWTANKIKVQFNMNGGEWAGSTNTSLSTDSEGYVLVNGGRHFTTYTYGQTGIDLANYNNSSTINIRKLGYTADASAAWNTKADGSGTSFSQDGGVSANNLCNASSGDCTVTLYVKWRDTKLTVNYYSNGATHAFSGALNTVGADKNVLVRTGEFYYSTAYPSGLHDWLYIGDGTWMNRDNYGGSGYWGTTTTGGTQINQSTAYDTGNALAQALSKDISYTDQTIDLYAIWYDAYFKMDTSPTTYWYSFGYASASASNGNTITQIKNDSSSVGFFITKNITFNPNGYTYTRTGEQLTVSDGATFTITGSGKIVGTSANSSNKFLIATSGASTITVASGSTVTLENNYHTLATSGGTINANGGTIKSNNQSGIVVTYGGSGTINAAGATVNGSTHALFMNQGPGKINFSKGTLTGGNGIYNIGGTVTMTGGTINTVADKNGIYFTNGTANSTNYVASGTISGGTINSVGNDSTLSWAINNSGTGTINISGGTFKGTGAYGCGIINSGTGFILMTGGTITSNGKYGQLVYNSSTGGVKLYNVTMSMTYSNSSSSDNSTHAIGNGTYSTSGSHAEMSIGGTTTLTVADGQCIRNIGGDLRIHNGTITSGSASYAIYNQPDSTGALATQTGVTATSVISGTRYWGRTYVGSASVTGGTYGIYTTAGNYSVSIGYSGDALSTSKPIITGTTNSGVGGNSDKNIYLDNGIIRTFNRDVYAVQGGKSYIKTTRSNVAITYKDMGSGSYHYYYLKAA